jgi:3-hydroxybutyrate dehydrogenase
MTTSARRVALVTGSTSGIGLGVARALAASGQDIVLNGFGDAKEIEAIGAGIEAEHEVKVRYHAADMTRPQEIAEMVAFAQRELGSLDVVVNNAGIQHTASIEEFPVAKWDAILAINLSSAFHVVQHALPGMRARNWGRVINIASAHGLVASPFKAAYVAAKHGLVGFTKVLALETATTGITANAICPGWVLTPLVQKQIDAAAAAEGVSIDEAQKRLVAAKQPSQRFATPEQIGALAVFLCTDAASSITGTSLPVDGGWTAQ